MTKAPLYTVQAESAGDIELPPEVFGVKPKKSVIHQVYVALQANARLPWAHTKKRGEVRGGGKKPWKQKGTGRARHGSIRSPIWKGGGVVFGPQSDRSFAQKINKKMNHLAMRMCLSDKVADARLLVLEDFTPTGKTKGMADLRKKLPGAGRKTMLVAAELSPALDRSTRNLPAVDTGRAMDLNVVDLLHHQYLIITKSGLKILEKRLQ